MAGSVLVVRIVALKGQTSGNSVLAAFRGPHVRINQVRLSTTLETGRQNSLWLSGHQFSRWNKSLPMNEIALRNQ
jgi:hypothetical protein